MPNIAAISIYVDDMERAVAFYEGVLGFGVKARPVPFITELDHEGAALVLCQAEQGAKAGYPTGACTVIGLATKDLDARYRDLGKKKVELLHAAPEPFPGGRYFAVRDPAGNVVELLEFGAS